MYFSSEYSDNIAKGSIPVQAHDKMGQLLTRYVKFHHNYYNIIARTSNCIEKLQRVLRASLYNVRTHNEGVTSPLYNNLLATTYNYQSLM